jgi:uncharacterized SAM-binding protein YcdF (DUF218 family)
VRGLFPVGELNRVAVRTTAIWIGLLTLVNVAARLRHPVFDANLWWIDLRFLPAALSSLLLVVASSLLIAHGIRPAARGHRRTATLGALALLGVVAILNTAGFYLAWWHGAIAPRVPLPLSLVLAVILSWLAASVWARPSVCEPPRRSFAAIAAVIVSLLFVAGIPLGQMVFFGTTDYRRPADAIVVFGAKVELDGRASITLADRVATAAELYRSGLAPKVIMSGGVEPSGLDETVVMRDLAEDLGVPRSAIVLDPQGVTTSATVQNTTRMFSEEGIARVLAVSQYYHLTRIKLAYARDGVDVWTVPSRATPIPQNQDLAVREIPAFWLYYLRGVLT